MQDIGARVREARNARRLTIRELADLAGLPKSTLADIESGRHTFGLDNLELLSKALGVSWGYLLGLPIEPNDPERLMVDGYVEGIRSALMDTELGEPTSDDARPVPVLAGEAAQASDAYARGDLIGASRALPAGLFELHHHAASDGPDQADALRGLIIALRVTCSVTKAAGNLDLSWLAMLRARDAAQRLDDPAWTGFTDFYASHALHPYTRALANTRHGIDRIEPHAGEPGTLHVYGMLHLMAAYGSAVLGRDDDVRAHVAEATQIAEQTGDVNDEFAFYFGPANVNIWRVGIAVEQREGDRVAELASAVDLSMMTSRERRANLHRDVGRGMAQARRDREATAAFLQAEALAPGTTRNSPLVRDDVRRILRRANAATATEELRGLARRMGIAPHDTHSG